MSRDLKLFVVDTGPCGFGAEPKQVGELNQIPVSGHGGALMGVEHPKFRGPVQPVRDWRANAQLRIDDQRTLIAKLEPGSDAHRTAVQILLLYQDSLHVLSETDDMLIELQRRNRK